MTLSLLPDHLDRDWQIRFAAFAALRAVCDRTGGIVTRAELQHGFEVEGVRGRIPFASRGAGIWKPEVMPNDPGAALTVMTSLSDPYGDRVSEDGWLEYSYQRGPINNHFNESLRNAFRHQRAMIYLRALEKGVFSVIHPVFVHSDHPELRVARLAVDTPAIGESSLVHGGSPELLKRYATTTTLVRLHQDKFRFQVLGAYGRTCSVCGLGSQDRLVRLLDAAHILPDNDPRGLPIIPNGLSLCKIHHSAYDLNILGIDPDYRIHVRKDILAEIDGPMLRYGIQGLAGEAISTPSRKSLRPNREFLAERYDGFRAA
ncbi:MAG: HNH endonuclease [Gemmatimonadales bacterium]